MKLSIIVPLYNEVENVHKLHAELLPVAEALVGTSLPTRQRINAVEVLFVDDGSSDGTGTVLRSVFDSVDKEHSDHPVAVRVIGHAVNRGVGAALRTAFAQAGGDVVVTTDGDGTYAFADIPKLLTYLTPGVSIVTASPYHPQGGVNYVPQYRLFLSQGASLLYRVVVDWRIHTYTALFRAYKREVTKSIVHRADGFLGGTELMVRAMLAGFQVAEFPTTLHSRQHGVSKAKIARTIKAHLGFLFQVLGWRFGKRPADRLSTPTKVELDG